MQVDEAGASAYLTRTMLRRLLTLLAIISGFTAMAAPASARVAALEEAQVQLAGESQQACRIVEAEQLSVARQGVKQGAVILRCRARALAVITPTVQLSVDRARE